MRKLFAVGILALLVSATHANAQTIENAQGVNAVNAYGLLAHFPHINVRYTCGVNESAGGVVVEYTDGSGIMHFSPVLIGACTDVASGPTFGKGQVHTINFSATETVTLGDLNIAVNPASFTVVSGYCRAGCQWGVEPGYSISISVSTTVASLSKPPCKRCRTLRYKDGPAPMPCGCNEGHGCPCP